MSGMICGVALGTQLLYDLDARFRPQNRIHENARLQSGFFMSALERRKQIVYAMTQQVLSESLTSA